MRLSGGEVVEWSGNNLSSGAKTPAFESWLLCLLAVWPWANYLISCALSLLTNKVGILIAPSSQSCCEEWSTLCLAFNKHDTDVHYLSSTYIQCQACVEGWNNRSDWHSSYPCGVYTLGKIWAESQSTNYLLSKESLRRAEGRGWNSRLLTFHRQAEQENGRGDTGGAFGGVGEN